MRNNKRVTISNAVLWAAAILAAAIAGAPQFFTLILLPVLGFMSVMNLRQRMA